MGGGGARNLHGEVFHGINPPEEFFCWSNFVLEGGGGGILWEKFSWRRRFTV